MIDPDVILGHNFENVDYGIFLHRMKDCSVSHWSKVGRMRRSEWPKSFGRGGMSWAERQIIAGRLICDLSNDMGRVWPWLYHINLIDIEFSPCTIVDFDGTMSTIARNKTFWDWRWKGREEMDLECERIDRFCEPCRGWHLFCRCYCDEIDDAPTHPPTH